MGRRPSRLAFGEYLRGCESFHHSDLILRSPSEARASRRMAASPNSPPWFETARCARLLTMRPSAESTPSRTSLQDLDRHPEVRVLFARASKDDAPKRLRRDQPDVLLEI